MIERSFRIWLLENETEENTTMGMDTAGHRSGHNFTQESSTARSGGGGDTGGRRDTVTESYAMANPRGRRPDPKHNR